MPIIPALLLALAATPAGVSAEECSAANGLPAVVSVELAAHPRVTSNPTAIVHIENHGTAPVWFERISAAVTRQKGEIISGFSEDQVRLAGRFALQPEADIGLPAPLHLTENVSGVFFHIGVSASRTPAYRRPGFDRYVAKVFLKTPLRVGDRSSLHCLRPVDASVLTTNSHSRQVIDRAAQGFARCYQVATISGSPAGAELKRLGAYLELLDERLGEELTAAERQALGRHAVHARRLRWHKPRDARLLLGTRAFWAPTSSGDVIIGYGKTILTTSIRVHLNRDGRLSQPPENLRLEGFLERKRGASLLERAPIVFKGGICRVVSQDAELGAAPTRPGR